ncbi:MAG TPA: 50S ribosomal protein L4 [Gemmatimonadaceae bacterium]|nr:50S ribosomal protein L4 [Gemmatimonadaceae bacterium]
MAETTSLDAAAFTNEGAAQGRTALPPELFDGVVNMPVMHQAVKAFLANQRQGNAATKTRGRVIGGNRKPWKQKGTGRARQGSSRAPHWVGGGTVFGPHPRSYAQYIPRRVRALARKSALNARAREGALLVVQPLAFEQPKTARMVALLRALGVDGQKVLVLTHDVRPAVHLSARNLPLVHVMPYRDVSTYHLLWSDVVVIESPALVENGDATEAESAAGSTEPGAPGDAAGAAAPSAGGSATPRKSRATGRGGAEKAGAAASRKRAAGTPAAKSPRTRKTAAKTSSGKSAAKAAGARKKTTARKVAARKSSAGKGAAKRSTSGTAKGATRKTAARKSASRPKKQGGK